MSGEVDGDHETDQSASVESDSYYSRPPTEQQEEEAEEKGYLFLIKGGNSLLRSN